MTELTISLVSRMDVAGEDVSPEYGSLSPPTTHRFLQGSNFKGRWSHTNVAYVTFFPAGKSDCRMNLIVSVEFMPCILPFARRPNSLLNALSQHSLLFE